MRPIFLLAATIGALITTAAEATLRLQANGKITTLDASVDYVPQDTPTGAFGIGDAWSFTMDFDPLNSVEDELTIPDPNAGTYYNFGALITVRIGSFSNSFTTSLGSNMNRIQLVNNAVLESDPPITYDVQSFDTRNDNIDPAEQAFDYGYGQASSAAYLTVYDTTGLARSSKNISEIVDPNLFNLKEFFFNSARGEYLGNRTRFWNVTATGTVDSVSLSQVTAVPETSTWAMMLMGFGLLGAVTRRRRTTTVAYA